jgi:hypothetical protein
MGIVNKLWWRFMPGTSIKVPWPVGDILITEDDPRWDWTVGPSKYTVHSADPNDHYRLEIESKVGRQGWDWDWTLTDNDINNNTLTIKFRRGKEHLAPYFALRWS